MQDTPMIQASGLSKYYGNFAAIDDVSFTIAKGEVVAFLGPNGAGKSTTMKLLTGYLAPSRGIARIAGWDVSAHRVDAARRLGYLPENGPLYLDMTPRGILSFFARCRGMSGSLRQKRIDAVVAQCGLADVLSKPIKKLSRGYRQRVGMAQALIHEPDILILDEPTAGLDPNQIHDVREHIAWLGKTKTILLSTHILQEVEAMATRIIFISDGRIRFDGPVKEFSKDTPSMDVAFRSLAGAGQPAAT